MEDRGEVLYELKPKYDFLYELTMPTGKKMKSSLGFSIFMLILSILAIVFNDSIISLGDVTLSSIYNVSKIICFVLLIFSLIVLFVKIGMQVMEYNGMSYKFYKDCMVFENNFMSQTKKTIEYSNIKEVEIRRTIIDRILNYGIIVIYTNADKAYGSATVLYAIKNIQEHYNNIESLIHNGSVISSPIKTGDTNRDFVEEVKFQNAMNRTEVYNDSNAESDTNPLNKNVD